MSKQKPVRTRGKLQLSKYFQKLEEGDSVAVVREKSLNINFPERLQGRTGKIKGRRGKAFVVEIKDISKDKSYLIEPIHLKKLK